MFDKFKLINRDNYDIKIEGKKLELKKIIDKLLSYGQTKKNNLKSNNKNNENTHTKKKQIINLIINIKLISLFILF